MNEKYVVSDIHTLEYVNLLEAWEIEGMLRYEF